MIKMMEITNDYMLKWRITINWKKTNYIIVGNPKIKVKDIVINDNKLDRVVKMKYL